MSLLEKRPEGVKRGRKLLDVDLRLVIILEWLRYEEIYQELAFSFKITNSQVQTSITSLWNVLIQALFEDIIPKNPLDYEPKRTFDNYPGAIGALDASLIPIVKPKDNIDKRLYYSGKHHRHGVKVQVLVAPDGQVIHYGGILPGSRHDFILYQESKLAADMTRTLVNKFGALIPNRPQILADSGYMGIHASYPEAVLPIKKPRNRELERSDVELNNSIGHDRCIAECFFARLKNTWAILRVPYRSDESTIEGLIKICICLTCLKIRNAPLQRDKDSHDPVVSYEEEWEEDNQVSVPLQHPTITVETQQNIPKKRRSSLQKGPKAKVKINTKSFNNNNNSE